jgi:diguanylate cyclase (GGDEF)-like protein
LMAAMMPLRVTVANAVLAVAAIIALSLGTDAGAVGANPLPLIAAVMIVVCLITATWGLVDAETQYRGESTIDPLTGLLNRSSLERRFAEIRDHAHVLGAPVCMLACDLDKFKAINDAHGHDRGDDVLRDSAYAMRKALRSFELVYRVGGEEFLVVLPGIGTDEGERIAERLRAAVEDARPAGLPVTISVGVAAATGDGIDYAHLREAADVALYSAKRTGRNRVAVSSQAPARLEHALSPT